MADHNIDTPSSSSTDELGTIVSLAPFQERARILSDRCLDFLHSTKSIEFVESFFVKHDDSEENKALQRRAFADFICHWMARHHEPFINTFSLTFSRPLSFRQDIKKCIAFANGCHVKELSLDFHDPMWGEDDEAQYHAAAFHLPLDVYQQHYDVESLKLFSCAFILTEFQHFRSLKKLSLGWIELSVDIIGSLLMDIPSLESFSLKKCSNIHHIQIALPNLRLQTLVLDRCNFRQYVFHIEAPNLRVFKYFGKVGLFFFELQQNMVDVELDFALEFTFKENGDLFHNLLEQLHSVRVLTVCSYMLQVAPRGMVGLSTTLNVRELILKTAMHWKEFCGIEFMLKSCPVLETLTINIVPARLFHDCYPPYQFKFRELHSCKCIRRTLRVIEVNGFRGTNDEVLMLKHLVRFGNVMEELNLYVSNEVDANGGNNRETYLEKAQIMQALPKASATLNISIH